MWDHLPCNSIYELFSARVHQPLHSNTNIHITGYHNKTPVLRMWSRDTHDNTKGHHILTMSSLFLISDIQVLADTHYLASCPSSQITETNSAVLGGSTTRWTALVLESRSIFQPMLFLDVAPHELAQHTCQISASKFLNSVLVSQKKSLAHGDCY